MAALFTAASTQYLLNSAPAVLPATGYPLTVGMWVNLTAVGAVARTLFAFSDTATTNNYLMLRMDASEQLNIVARAGGTENAAAALTSLVAGSWAFVIAVFASSSNRKIAVLAANGALFVNATTTARAPTGMDAMTIGALSTSGGITEPWDGLIGEYWLLNTDLGDGTTALNLNSGLIRTLAYGGPFSVPHLAPYVVEYRSFRKALVSDADDPTEVFHGSSRQVWANTNGVTLARQHPPLPYWFVKPGQTIRPLVI